MAETRLAGPADVPALVRTLTRAFAEDPVASWSCPPAALRPRVLETFYRIRLHQMLDEQEVWTTEGCASAALWARPAQWRTSAREDLALGRCMLHPRLLARLPLVAAGLLGVERRHPHQPAHWYLAVLATDPQAQGQGLGSAVLGPVLERCDRDRVGAYLESSSERNIDFYGRHGFRVSAELHLPRGPSLWAMWREPRA